MEPYLPKKVLEGPSNILFVEYDDTRLASWSPFGGRINMPTLQKLADKGLMYSLDIKPEQKFISGELKHGKYTKEVLSMQS